MPTRIKCYILTKPQGLFSCRARRLFLRLPRYEGWSLLAHSLVWHGSLNVPIEHHPTIRYMVYNGYYKVMSNIPKMGHLPTPVWTACWPHITRYLCICCAVRSPFSKPFSKPNNAWLWTSLNLNMSTRSRNQPAGSFWDAQPPKAPLLGIRHPCMQLRSGSWEAFRNPKHRRIFLTGTVLKCRKKTGNIWCDTRALNLDVWKCLEDLCPILIRILIAFAWSFGLQASVLHRDLAEARAGSFAPQSWLADVLAPHGTWHHLLSIKQAAWSFIYI